MRTTLAIAAVFVFAACDATETTRSTSPRTVPVAPAQWTLQLLNASVTDSVDVWMGAPIPHAVRVYDSRGKAAAFVAVRFELSDSSRTSVTVLSDDEGVAKPSDLVMPIRDTTSVVYTVRTVVVGQTASPLSFAVRAWRDVSQFGGNGSLVLSVLPIARSSVAAILPLGTFGRDDALPSADAMVVPVASTPVPVLAVADGLITEIDLVHGAITFRVRNGVRVRVSGLTVSNAQWVGRVVHEGETIGMTVPRGANGEDNAVGIRVLDGSVQRTNFVRPERYGARRSAVFFARYLVDSLRSATFALVRRAAPDLDGRFDYDRQGTLVGTWFAAGALAAVLDAPLISARAMFLATAQTVSERDPSSALGPIALTFAYDAEHPGEIRIAAGSALAQSLGVSGVRAVAWEDGDPAAVGQAQGIVQYQLYATDDNSRIGRSPETLLVQMLDESTLRAEVVIGPARPTGFSPRAITLVR